MSHRRVWIYCRTAHPDTGSLVAQETYMIGYAEKQGYTIAGVTSEHGSGLDFLRSGIRAVSHAIETGAADALLVRDFSRLGRDGCGGDGCLPALAEKEPCYPDLCRWDDTADLYRFAAQSDKRI